MRCVCVVHALVLVVLLTKQPSDQARRQALWWWLLAWAWLFGFLVVLARNGQIQKLHTILRFRHEATGVHALHFSFVLIAPKSPVLLAQLLCFPPGVARANIDISFVDRSM
jgi:uncharacterized membrane protein